MTIEASLIIPMVLCVFVLLIYFSYYLYGRCMLSQDSYILAFRATRSRSFGFGDDMASFVSSKADEKAGKKYFGSSRPFFEPEISGKKITVKGGAEVRHRAMKRYFLMPESGFEYAALGKAKRWEYAEHIRKLTRIKDIGSEIIDLDTGDERWNTDTTGN